jgi:hypothetical protein
MRLVWLVVVVGLFSANAVSGTMWADAAHIFLYNQSLTTAKTTLDGRLSSNVSFNGSVTVAALSPFNDSADVFTSVLLNATQTPILNLSYDPFAGKRMNVTWETWWRSAVSAPAYSQGIFSLRRGGSGAQLYYDVATQQFTCFWQPGQSSYTYSVNSSVVVLSNASWFHLACVLNENWMTLVINGTNVSHQDFVEPLEDVNYTVFPSSTLLVGGYPLSTAKSAAYFAHTRFWNMSRSDLNVSALFDQTLTEIPPPPSSTAVWLYSLTTDANVSRAVGINVSGGEAKMFRRQPRPNTTTEDCANTSAYITTFFAEYNNTLGNVTNVSSASCSQGVGTAQTTLTPTGSTNWYPITGQFGQALRLSGGGTNGKLCYRTDQNWYNMGNNDAYFSAWVQWYAWPASTELIRFNKNWMLKTDSNSQLVFEYTRGPDTISYNKDIIAGAGSRLVDGEWHHVEVVQSNFTGVRETAFFLDGDLRVYGQQERVMYDGDAAGAFCVGGTDMAVDQVLIRNYTAGHVNWNQTYYERNHTYSLMGAQLYLDPIDLGVSGQDIYVNATFTYPNNATRIYVTGFFGDVGALQDKWIRNATVSFSQDTCGQNTPVFLNNGYNYFVSRRNRFTCEVYTGYNTTAIDYMATNGVGADMGIEIDPDVCSAVASAKNTYNLNRGYGSFVMTNYADKDSEQNLECTAQAGYILANTAANFASMNTWLSRTALRTKNCGSTGNTLDCYVTQTDYAKTYQTWSIIAAHYNNAEGTSTLFDDFLEYATLNGSRAEVLSVREAQQKWFCELNASGCVIRGNQTSRNFTPVFLFFGDGASTPVLQDVRISVGASGLNVSEAGTGPTITWTSPTPNLTGTDELHAYANITLNASIVIGTTESANLTALNFTWNGTTVPLIESPLAANGSGLIFYSDFDQNITVGNGNFNVTDQSGAGNNFTSYIASSLPITWDPQGYISIHGGTYLEKHLHSGNNSGQYTGFRINGSTIALWANRTNNWSYPGTIAATEEVLFSANFSNPGGQTNVNQLYITLNSGRIRIVTWNGTPVTATSCYYALPTTLMSPNYNNPNAWHSIAVSFNTTDSTNSTNATVLFDNQVIPRTTGSNCQITGVNAVANRLTLGTSIRTDHRDWNGSLDEVRIYNRTLRQNDLLLLSQTRLSRSTSTTYTFTSYLYNTTSSIIQFNNLTNGTFPYILQANNSDGSTLSASSFGVQLKVLNLTLNTSTSLGFVDRLTGSTTRVWMVLNATTLRPDNNASNTTWHQEQMTQSGLKILRVDVSSAYFQIDLRNKDFSSWNSTTNFELNTGSTTNTQNFLPGWKVVEGTAGNSLQFARTNGSTGAQDDFGLLINNSNEGDTTGLPANFGKGFGYAFQSFSMPGGHTYTLEAMIASNISAVSNILRIQVSNSSYSCLGTSPGTTSYTNVTCTTAFESTDTTGTILLYPAIAGRWAKYDRIRLYQDGITWYPPAAVGSLINVTQWASTHNATALFIIDETSLANSDINVTDECWTFGNYCMPTNMSYWKKQVITWLNKTTLNGSLNTSVAIEVWNEPNGRVWLPNSTNQTEKIRQYNILYNATRSVIKEFYPDMWVGGPTVGPDLLNFDVNYKPWFMGFLNNSAGVGGRIFDFISVHPYSQAAETNLPDLTQDTYTAIQANCTSVGLTCPHILMSEFQSGNSAQKANQSTSMGSQFAAAYSVALRHPGSITLMPYQWSEQWNYTQDGSVGNRTYPEYPSKWHMVLEPHLTGDAQGELTSVYNVTKWFNQLFPPDSVVVNTTSTNARTYVVGGVNASRTYLVISNTDEVPVSVSVRKPGGIDAPTFLKDITTNVTYAYDPVTQVFANVTLDTNGVGYFEILYTDSTVNSTLRYPNYTNLSWPRVFGGNPSYLTTLTSHLNMTSSLNYTPLYRDWQYVVANRTATSFVVGAGGTCVADDRTNNNKPGNTALMLHTALKAVLFNDASMLNVSTECLRYWAEDYPNWTVRFSFHDRQRMMASIGLTYDLLRNNITETLRNRIIQGLDSNISDIEAALNDTDYAYTNNSAMDRENGRYLRCGPVIMCLALLGDSNYSETKCGDDASTWNLNTYNGLRAKRNATLWMPPDGDVSYWEYETRTCYPLWMMHDRMVDQVDASGNHFNFSTRYNTTFRTMQYEADSLFYILQDTKSQLYETQGAYNRTTMRWLAVGDSFASAGINPDQLMGSLALQNVRRTSLATWLYNASVTESKEFGWTSISGSNNENHFVSEFLFYNPANLNQTPYWEQGRLNTSAYYLEGLGVFKGTTTQNPTNPQGLYASLKALDQNGGHPHAEGGDITLNYNGEVCLDGQGVANGDVEREEVFHNGLILNASNVGRFNDGGEEEPRNGRQRFGLSVNNSYATVGEGQTILFHGNATSKTDDADYPNITWANSSQRPWPSQYQGGPAGQGFTLTARTPYWRGGSHVDDWDRTLVVYPAANQTVIVLADTVMGGGTPNQNYSLSYMSPGIVTITKNESGTEGVLAWNVSANSTECSVVSTSFETNGSLESLDRTVNYSYDKTATAKNSAKSLNATRLRLYNHRDTPYAPNWTLTTVITPRNQSRDAVVVVGTSNESTQQVVSVTAATKTVVARPLGLSGSLNASGLSASAALLVAESNGSSVVAAYVVNTSALLNGSMDVLHSDGPQFTAYLNWSVANVTTVAYRTYTEWGTKDMIRGVWWTVSAPNIGRDNVSLLRSQDINTVLVYLSGSTNLSAVQDAARLLHSYGMRLYGVVLSDPAVVNQSNAAIRGSVLNRLVNGSLDGLATDVESHIINSTYPAYPGFNSSYDNMRYYLSREANISCLLQEIADNYSLPPVLSAVPYNYQNKSLYVNLSNGLDAWCGDVVPMIYVSTNASYSEKLVELNDNVGGRLIGGMNLHNGSSDPYLSSTEFQAARTETEALTSSSNGYGGYVVFKATNLVQQTETTRMSQDDYLNLSLPQATGTNYDVSVTLDGRPLSYLNESGGRIAWASSPDDDHVLVVTVTSAASSGGGGGGGSGLLGGRSCEGNTISARTIEMADNLIKGIGLLLILVVLLMGAALVLFPVMRPGDALPTPLFLVVIVGGLVLLMALGGIVLILNQVC